MLKIAVYDEGKKPEKLAFVYDAAFTKALYH